MNKKEMETEGGIVSEESGIEINEGERERETEEERRRVKMRGRETKRAKRNCLSEKRRETVEDPTQGL